MWKARPDDPTGYQYFKYSMLVKYLLEQEKISVDELFTRDFDADALASTVLKPRPSGFSRSAAEAMAQSGCT